MRGRLALISVQLIRKPRLDRKLLFLTAFVLRALKWKSCGLLGCQLPLPLPQGASPIMHGPHI
jgi:hypothetical protein